MTRKNKKILSIIVVILVSLIIISKYNDYAENSISGRIDTIKKLNISDISGAHK